MNDHFDNFIQAMRATGCGPARDSDVIDGADNKLIQADDDKQKTKTLYYTFAIEGDRASGRWFSCKLQQGDSWFSRSNREWSAEEKAKWKAKRDADKKARQEELEAGYEKISVLANELWDKAEKNKSHPYLKNKGIKLSGARVYKGNLLIPLRDSSKKIWLLQTILKDGTKYNSFITGQDSDGKDIWASGGRKQGCYHSIIKKGVSLDVIGVCEGYATGASIAEAAELAVVVALDTGNLKVVAQAMRTKFPGATIIICADNDQWTLKQPRPKKLKTIDAKKILGDDGCWDEWREAGYLYNPGRDKGAQAAVSVDGLCVYPDIPANDIDRRTDYNDVANTDGPDAVKDRILGVLEVEQGDNIIEPEYSMVPEQPMDGPQFMEPVPDYVMESAYAEQDHGQVVAIQSWPTLDDSQYEGLHDNGAPKWFDQVVWKVPPRKDGTGGKPAKDSGQNTRVYMENLYGGIFKFNYFEDCVFLDKCPPWEKAAAWKPRPIEDTDEYSMAAELEKHQLGFSERRTRGAIDIVAKNFEYHPVRDYFEKLQWDGTQRLGTWLKTYAHATSQDEAYLAVIGRMWMTAAVRRIYHPGVKFDHMLVLEGKTSIGKSSLLSELTTIGGATDGAYFCDVLSLKDIDKPKALYLVQGKICIEFAELDGMDDITDGALKSWITQCIDEYVPKYSNNRKKRPRQFILAGTTNESVWLRDATGNRRYWPVHCSKIELAQLRKDKDQLWAEAVHLHKSGEKIWLSDNDPIYKTAQIEQVKRLATDSWEDAILAIVEDEKFITTQWVIEKLGFQLQKVSNTDVRRIGNILRSAGWENGQHYAIVKHKKRGWLHPDHKNIVTKEPEVAEKELDF